MLQVPWASLGRSPAIVELDRLYLLAGPKEEESPEDEEHEVNAHNLLAEPYALHLGMSCLELL